MNELADAIGASLGKPVERRYAPARAGDIRDSWADIERRARGARLGADASASRRACALTVESLAWLSRSASCA